VYKLIGADGQEYGPVTVEVLKQWLDEGRVNSQTRVRPEGTTEWKTVAEIPDLARLITTSPPPALAPILTPGPISIQPTPRNNSLAVAGLTLGILSITLGLCCCYGLPFSIPGIICSSVALSQIKKDPFIQQGKGLAVAGLILSIVSLLLGALILAFVGLLSTPDMIRRLQKL
jgi:hypothetical protein